MDLSTVRKNLEKGRFKYFEEFFSDVQLIWSNCKNYNVSGSDIYRLAENMERRSKKLIRDLKEQLKIENPSEFKNGKAGGSGDSSEDDEERKDSKKKEVNGGSRKGGLMDEDDDDFGYDPERYVPFDEKVEFADLMKRATKDGLTNIVNYLLEKQPEAVEDYGNDRLQIKVDMIEKQAFQYCKDVLNQNLKEAPNKRQKTQK
ncbi:bromodomain containing protein [Stylonychia lemnae]|uniref:Bromodomain containing protein n=1 Tax=Stylonychia lemnae TaxID=5949 RepID=A0A078B0D4_STYLE|nr:bromodomain containing protein [Stylonychia lemnae]|eukprot:CDW88115.1 bromodomain containing protein [Stylonychia lemnae]